MLNVFIFLFFKPEEFQLVGLQAEQELPEQPVVQQEEQLVRLPVRVSRHRLVWWVTLSAR